MAGSCPLLLRSLILCTYPVVGRHVLRSMDEDQWQWLQFTAFKLTEVRLYILFCKLPPWFPQG